MFQLGRASRSHPRVSDPLFLVHNHFELSKKFGKEKKLTLNFLSFSVCRNHLRLCLGCHNQERIWDGLTNRKEKGLKTIPSPPPPTFVFFFHFEFVKFRPNWNSAPPTFFLSPFPSLLQMTHWGKNRIFVQKFNFHENLARD